MGSPQQIQGLPTCNQGISAIKALQVAASQGQKIYTITQAVYASNPNIVNSALSAHSATTKQAISNALGAGMEVTIHERPITIDGWTGAGYTKIDPNTGAGGYMIDGGGNGGVLQGFGVDGLVAILATIVEGWGKIGEVASKLISIAGHIVEISELVFSDCSAGQKIAGIISVTLLTIGLLLMAPAFAVFGLLAAIIYSLVSLAISSTVAYGWNSICK